MCVISAVDDVIHSLAPVKTHWLLPVSQATAAQGGTSTPLF